MKFATRQKPAELQGILLREMRPGVEFVVLEDDGGILGDQLGVVQRSWPYSYDVQRQIFWFVGDEGTLYTTTIDATDRRRVLPIETFLEWKVRDR